MTPNPASIIAAAVDASGSPASSPADDAKGIIRIVSGSGFRYVTPFPWTLHQLLCEAEETAPGIVSWMDEGRCFRVHNTERFIRDVAPKYFKHKSYKSFQRQLYLYGFQRISAGDQRGSYFHPKFVRSDRELTHEIARTNAPTSKPRRGKVKAARSAAANVASSLQSQTQIQPQSQQVSSSDVNASVADMLPSLPFFSAPQPAIGTSTHRSASNFPSSLPLESTAMTSSFVSNSGNGHFECAVPSSPVEVSKCIYDHSDERPTGPSVSSFQFPSLNQSLPMPVFSVTVSEKSNDAAMLGDADGTYKAEFKMVDGPAMPLSSMMTPAFAVESDCVNDVPATALQTPTCHDNIYIMPPTEDLRQHADDIIALFGSSSVDGEPLEEGDVVTLSSTSSKPPSEVNVPFLMDIAQSVDDGVFSSLCERISSSVSAGPDYDDENDDAMSEISSISVASFLDDPLF